MIKEWNELPDFIRVPEVRPYYDVLRKKRLALAAKRVFDFIAALLLLLLLAVPMLIIAVWIKLDSPGEIMYRQDRVTTYGRRFKIHKFRTMVSGADRTGAALTVQNDARVTKAGRLLRRLRLDELPQLLDVLGGSMSFVGTRPEAVRYVEQYKPEYRATLLLPAGITSEASIRFLHEEELLSTAEDVDRIYMEEILPEKMRWNLESIERFGLMRDIKILLHTIGAVFGGKRRSAASEQSPVQTEVKIS